MDNARRGLPATGIPLATAFRRLLAPVTGVVLEVGAGAGTTFTLYGPDVTGVIALEPDPVSVRAARHAAALAHPKVVWCRGRAEALPLSDASVDLVVLARVLCSVADPAASLAELRRVLAPGGRIRLLEHFRPTNALGLELDRLDEHGFPSRHEGCRMSSQPLALLRAAGFETRTEHVFWKRWGAGLPVVPNVIADAYLEQAPPVDRRAAESEISTGG